MKLQDLPLPVRHASVLMLLVLAGLLTGCATPSAPSDFTPKNPSMPAPSASQPQQTYSSRAQADIQIWQKKLTDTLATP